MSRLRTTPLTPALAPALLAAVLAGGAFPAWAAPAAAGTRACGDSAIAVTATHAQGAAGHSTFVLEFQNISGARCTLRGYPGLDAIGRHGHVLKHALRRRTGATGGSKRIRTITLRPNRFASADVGWQNFANGGGDCRFSVSVNATPAGTGYTVHLARSVSLCDLEVHPTVSGKSGQG